MTIHWVRPTTGSSEPVYLYDIPGRHVVDLKGIFITQHGKKIRVVSAAVRDLDRISKTPEIGNKDNEEMQDLFKRRRNVPWQRSLNHQRMGIIRTWWMKNSSYSANPPLIYIERDEFEFNDAESECQLSLDPTDWTFPECPKRGCNWKPEDIDASFAGWFSDVCPSCGHTDKPCIVVDGQHRIRGMSSDPAGQEGELIFSSFLCKNDGFDRNRVSKIFTEVTSAAVSLPKLHKEFLSAKYELAPEYDSTTPEGKRRKRAYTISSELNASASRWARTSAARKGRVEMIERSRGIPGDVIDVKRLAEYIYSYMTDRYTVGLADTIPLNGLTNDEITESLEEFLEAALDVWPGNNFWNNGRRPLGALQSRGIFRMLMHCYRIITTRLSWSGKDLNKSNYKLELNHIKNINWAQASWANTYTRQDADQNRTRRILKHIYDEAPIPITNTTTPIPTTINQWMGDQPEALTKNSITVDSGSDEFVIHVRSSFSQTSTGLPSVVNWPLNAKAEGKLTVKNLTNPAQFATVDMKTNNYSGNFSEVFGFSPSVGDVLDVEIEVFSWSRQSRKYTDNITVT